MKFDLKRPCPKCPFRTDVDSFITGARAREIATAMVKQGAAFSCHQTLSYDEDGETYSTPQSQFCAGAIIMLEKSGLAGHVHLIRGAERFGIYDVAKMDMDAPVFDSPKDFVEHHSR